MLTWTLELPSEAWIESLQEVCNDDEQFNRVAEWSDVTLVIVVGEERYWLKLYDGKIIDAMEYTPMSDPLGYDVILSGSREAWKRVLNAENTFWEPYSTGEITIDGNLLEANRMHEAIVRMCDLMAESGRMEVEA